MGLLDFFRKRVEPAPLSHLPPPPTVTDELDDEESSYEEELLESRIEGISTDDVVEEAMVRGEVEIAGGQGRSIEDAVIIEAPDSVLGWAAEKLFLERQYGPRLRQAPKPGQTGPDGQPLRGWMLRKRSHYRKGNKRFERLDVVLHDGSPRSVYFDVSGYYGKEPDIG